MTPPPFPPSSPRARMRARTHTHTLGLHADMTLCCKTSLTPSLTRSGLSEQRRLREQPASATRRRVECRLLVIAPAAPTRLRPPTRDPRAVRPPPPPHKQLEQGLCMPGRSLFKNHDCQPRQRYHPLLREGRLALPQPKVVQQARQRPASKRMQGPTMSTFGSYPTRRARRSAPQL